MTMMMMMMVMLVLLLMMMMMRMESMMASITCSNHQLLGMMRGFTT
jgi:hypothetical protein